MDNRKHYNQSSAEKVGDKMNIVHMVVMEGVNKALRNCVNRVLLICTNWLSNLALTSVAVDLSPDH